MTSTVGCSRSFCERLEYPFGPDVKRLRTSVWYRMISPRRAGERVRFNDGATFLPTPPDDLFRFDERIRGESKTSALLRVTMSFRRSRNTAFMKPRSLCVRAFAPSSGRASRKRTTSKMPMVGGSTLLAHRY